MSRVAGGVAAAILLALLFAYAFSMSAGGMDGMMMSNAALPQDGAAADPAVPVADGQMVMPDGSTMDMGAHPSESPAAAATDADPAASTPAAAEHEMVMGGAINWYVIGGLLALIAAGIALAAGLNEHLERRIATGRLVTEGACGE